LLRRADGVLHLSWNEWWEGSNLEPSFEGGKHFCEANLLYSTIWQLTYRDGEIGLLVNDWIFEHGGGDASDLYNAVQGLRAVNAPFEIVLQSEATLEKLRRYRVLVAPAGGVGFGFNAKGERIDEVLRTWLQLGERTLITSQGGARDRGQGKERRPKFRPASLVPRPVHSTFSLTSAFRAMKPFWFKVSVGGKIGASCLKVRSEPVAKPLSVGFPAQAM
jgi:diadenosine tetraphosphatase ApaH/serine/threonine PP2A family protein phosphatase